MEFKAYKYQETAIDKIINNRAAALLLDMGMGKTISTLTAIWELMLDRFEVAKVLIIAPLRVAAHTWPEEIKKWDHLEGIKISKILGDAKTRRAALTAKANVFVINRENVDWLVEELKSNWFFDMVVIDELSSFKSSKAKRFRSLRKVRPHIERIVGLTGTPAPNSLIDLWPQLYLLDQGERLGKTKKYFLNRYFDSISNNARVGGKLVTYPTYTPKEGAEEAIYKKLEDICISMKAVDYLDMPQRIENVVRVSLTEEDTAKYKTLEKKRILQFVESNPVTAKSAVSLTGKLLQLANGAVYDEEHEVQIIHDEKLKALEDLVEAANGKPVMVFYAYRHDLNRLKKHFPGSRQLKTTADIDDWNNGKIKLLLVHPASAGHGLNLQAGGNMIVWFGLTWSLELYQQANARLYRQGQKNTVYIHHLVTEGTVDEAVMEVLKNKAKGQDALLEAVKARIKEVVNQ